MKKHLILICLGKQWKPGRKAIGLNTFCVCQPVAPERFRAVAGRFFSQERHTWGWEE